MKRNTKFLLLILLLGVGFAAISLTFYLNGTVQLVKDEADFDVKFTEAKLGAEDISETAITDNGSTITYATAQLKQVGEESNLNFKITNNSSLYDAQVTLNCSVGEHTDYYDISATIGGDTSKIIRAKQVKNGVITVKVKRTTLENITETFSCTISASAKERTTLPGEEPSLFVKAYKYNTSYESGEYCVRGDEVTCVATDCYKTKEEGSCPAGTIIKYAVNDNTEVMFHVMYDDANTITMQSQRDTVNNASWLSEDDYRALGGATGTSIDHNKGPITLLNALDAATANWTNVNEYTYKLGETKFFGTANNVCSSETNCWVGYSIAPRTGRARVITTQEAVSFGCTGSGGSCPIWMYNYLRDAVKYGATANGSAYRYWALTSSDATSYAWSIDYYGSIGSSYISGGFSLRAVIVVNKD